MQGIKIRKPRASRYLPGKGEIGFQGKPPEVLTGQIQGFKAAATEERLARALLGEVDWFRFSVIVVAPKDMPGWKQLDFVVGKRGIVKTIEVDTPFTHRDKLLKDPVHDAIALNELRKQYGDAVWPEVLRVNGAKDLVDQATAKKWVRKNL